MMHNLVADAIAQRFRNDPKYKTQFSDRSTYNKFKDTIFDHLLEHKLYTGKSVDDQIKYFKDMTGNKFLDHKTAKNFGNRAYMLQFLKLAEQNKVPDNVIKKLSLIRRDKSNANVPV